MAADFRHEQERMAWGLLEKNSVVRFVVDAYQEFVQDLTTNASAKGRNFPVTQETAPRLYRLYRLAAERVGVSEPVPLYLQMEYNLQAKTAGTDGDCAIFVDSACIEQYSDTRLLALFGHELAHIRYGHVRMLNINEMMDQVLTWIPFGGVAAETFKATLLEWRRFADYTADRGAAIAAGSADAVLQNLSQSMGRELDSEGVDAVLREVPDEKDLKMGVTGTALFQIMINSIQVPYGVWRMKQLKQWCASETCRQTFPTVYYGTRSGFGLEDADDGAALYEQFREMWEKNRKRALALLHAAADCGNMRANTRLGRYYLNGMDGLRKDAHNGLLLLRTAALAGDPEAWYILAGCFETGCGSLLPQDSERSAWLYCLAASSGYGEGGDGNLRQLPAISPKSMESLMNWFTENFYGGPAIFNELAPAEGLNSDCCPDIDALRTWLWIPGNETVYMTEFDMEQNGGFCRAIAIAATGIYVFDGQGLPFRLPWKKLKSCRIDARKKGERVTLFLNEKPLCSYNAKPPERAVGVMLVKIRKILNPQKS
ncbi:MAG: M48 family metalloprotease [Eubacteriales bacterium]|nr:M48 family metalloprotease [Eubacteriales bacterium]